MNVFISSRCYNLHNFNDSSVSIPGIGGTIVTIAKWLCQIGISRLPQPNWNRIHRHPRQFTALCVANIAMLFVNPVRNQGAEVMFFMLRIEYASLATNDVWQIVALSLCFGQNKEDHVARGFSPYLTHKMQPNQKAVG